jgi:prepilin-type N-terminal cleavage/methylation domain-containing protein
MHRLTSHARGRRPGFTLVELLIAITLTGLVMVGIVTFLRQSLMVYYSVRAEHSINRDIRAITGRFASDAVTANYFCLYPSFSTRTAVASGVVVDGSLVDGQVGDFLVLVYVDPAQASTGTSMITKLVGYYREVTDSTLNNGPVRRFEIPLSTPVDAKSTPMFEVLNTYVTGGISSYPAISQLAQGLATNTATQTVVTPPLFYNLLNRSVMISAQISASLTEKGVSAQTGNTYNFTISPRG